MSQEIQNLLYRSVENIYPNPAALEALLHSGKRLTVYAGFDPTGPTLHLGHAITLKKLAEMQRLGHRCIMLIGDFTAMIGDPTDKSAARAKLTREEVLRNCKEYKKQAEHIIDFDGPNPVELKFNSEWLANMTFAEVVELASHFTMQQMAERDMFQKRVEENKPIYLHEFLYPLMQGYDSVALNVDLEIGGNDQTFNMLAGRTLMKEILHKEKCVLTCKLLTDNTGKKMGKTEGNMLSLFDSPNDMYGKVMSWTDGMISAGFELATSVPMEEIRDYEKQMANGENPMTFKKQLAKEIVMTLMNADAAQEAAEHFNTVHQKQEIPNDIPVFDISEPMTIVDALILADLVTSKSEARRQIEQGAVRVNNEVVEKIDHSIRTGDILQKGKRFFAKFV